MSNNPFLKSKESNKSNNIFSSLQDNDKSSFKESSNKSNNKNMEYENSFTQSQKPQRREISSYNNRNKHREPSPPKGPDSSNLNLFPELTSIKENSTSTSTSTTANVEVSTKFKDILSNVIQDNKPELNTILPGWTRLSLVNRKTVIEYGPSTRLMIKQQQKEELQEQLDDEQNHIMFNAVESMKKNWERCEREYDEIHGEGVYTRKFRLSPVYGPEYETETDTEDETERYED